MILDIILCILVISSMIINLLLSDKIIKKSNKILYDTCNICNVDIRIIKLQNNIFEKYKRLENNDVATRHMIVTKFNEINNKLKIK